MNQKNKKILFKSSPPDEIVFNIAKFLSPTEINSFRLSSKQFLQVSNSPLIWEHICKGLRGRYSSYEKVSDDWRLTFYSEYKKLQDELRKPPSKQASELKKGDYVIIKGNPCKVVEISVPK